MAKCGLSKLLVKKKVSYYAKLPPNIQTQTPTNMQNSYSTKNNLPLGVSSISFTKPKPLNYFYSKIRNRTTKTTKQSRMENKYVWLSSSLNNEIENKQNDNDNDHIIIIRYSTDWYSLSQDRTTDDFFSHPSSFFFFLCFFRFQFKKKKK